MLNCWFIVFDCFSSTVIAGLTRNLPSIRVLRSRLGDGGCSSAMTVYSTNPRLTVSCPSINQRIQPQGREKHQQLPCGEEMGYFSCGEMMPRLLCLRQQVLKIEMDEDKRLEMEFKVFLRRKNVVVGELNLAFEVLAAAFGVELKDVRVCEMRLVFVLMLMPHAVQARLRRIDEATRQMMVFGAIMKLHVPSHRDEEHHKGHEQRTDFQQPFFHAAKIGIFLHPWCH